jgi:hypothetical protein
VRHVCASLALFVNYKTQNVQTTKTENKVINVDGNSILFVQVKRRGDERTIEVDGGGLARFVFPLGESIVCSTNFATFFMVGRKVIKSASLI